MTSECSLVISQNYNQTDQQWCLQKFKVGSLGDETGGDQKVPKNFKKQDFECYVQKVPFTSKMKNGK